jgi:acyl-CoA synthetase (NDP forming)
VKQYPVQKEVVEKIFKHVRTEKRTYLPEIESLQVFEAYGFPVLKSRLAKTEEEALKIAQEFGFPVVVKIASPAIVHKLDAGGVVIDIKDNTELSRAYRKVIATAEALVGKEKVWGAEIQQMAGKGIEIFLGSKRDPKFGPVILFGLGGTFVEVFRDISFRVAPLREWSTKAIIEKSKAGKILQGYRGQPADVDKISECLGRLSQLVMDFPEIEELDINPLMVYPTGNGARVLDGRIVLKPN